MAISEKAVTKKGFESIKTGNQIINKNKTPRDNLKNKRPGNFWKSHKNSHVTALNFDFE